MRTVFATVSQGGRLRIPRAILAALNVVDGEQLAFGIDGDRILVMKVERVVRWPK